MKTILNKHLECSSQAKLRYIPSGERIVGRPAVLGEAMNLLYRLRSKMNTNSAAGINREAQWAATVTDEGVSCTRPSGVIESVTWKDLRLMAIETTDEGPYLMDVFWLLAGEQTGCIIPQGATGEDALIESLQKLEGFDNEALIEAMSCTENQRFICWQKDDS